MGVFVEDGSLIAELQSVLNTLPSGDPLRRYKISDRVFRWTLLDVGQLLFSVGEQALREELAKRGLTVSHRPQSVVMWKRITRVNDSGSETIR